MTTHLSARGQAVVLCGHCAIEERFNLNGSLVVALRRLRRFRDRHRTCSGREGKAARNRGRVENVNDRSIASAK